MTILGLLITVAIIVFLSYFLINAYFFRRPEASETNPVVPQHAQDPTQYQNIIEGTRSFTNDINKHIKSQQQQIDDMLH